MAHIAIMHNHSQLMHKHNQWRKSQLKRKRSKENASSFTKKQIEDRLDLQG
jgi:hypothetical protein